MSQKISSDPAKSSKPVDGDGEGAKKKPRGKPFKKNNPQTGEIDERINRQGVRKFDELRHITLRLLNENITVGSEEKKLLMSQVEFVLRNWILSNDFQKQARALEYGFGKVPDEVKHSFDLDQFIMDNIDIFTDGQLVRIRGGESPLAILAELIRDNVAKKK